MDSSTSFTSLAISCVILRPLTRPSDLSVLGDPGAKEEDRMLVMPETSLVTSDSLFAVVEGPSGDGDVNSDVYVASTSMRHSEGAPFSAMIRCSVATASCNTATLSSRSSKRASMASSTSPLWFVSWFSPSMVHTRGAVGSTTAGLHASLYPSLGRGVTAGLQERCMRKRWVKLPASASTRPNTPWESKANMNAFGLFSRLRSAAPRAGTPSILSNDGG